MRSWPSWLAIALGAILLAAGLWVSLAYSSPDAGAGLLVAGAILLAAGLHALQQSSDSWCDCDSCMPGCDCDHCGECSGGGCCGGCACAGANGHTHQDGPGPAHSH